MSRVNLSARSDFTIAIAAVDGSVTAGLERDFGAFSAFGTGCREHLTRCPVAAILIAICFPCLTAFGAAFRLIGVALALKELLVLDAESKRSAAIGTL